MKNYLSFFVAGTLLFHTWAARAEPFLITGVAVVVNESVVTVGEIEEQVAMTDAISAKRFGNDRAGFERERLKLRDEAVEQNIENKLVLHDFVSSGYVTNVLEAFIDDQINEELRRDYHGDRAVLIRTLHEKGQTYEMFRQQRREEFIIRYMNYQNNSNLRKIIISPLKIEQYYQAHKDDFKMDDEVKVRMIVLPQSPDDPGSAKKVAEEILAKIDSGVPFAEMASVYTAGSQRTDGGDRGWVDRKYFKPELGDVAFSLKPGQHSGVIEQPEACYLMMIEDTKLAHVKDLAEVHEDIERTIRDQESLRLRKLWIDRLKRKSFVRFY